MMLSHLPAIDLPTISTIAHCVRSALIGRTIRTAAVMVVAVETPLSFWTISISLSLWVAAALAVFVCAPFAASQNVLGRNLLRSEERALVADGRLAAKERLSSSCHAWFSLDAMWIWVRDARAVAWPLFRVRDVECPARNRTVWSWFRIVGGAAPAVARANSAGPAVDAIGGYCSSDRCQAVAVLGGRISCHRHAGYFHSVWVAGALHCPHLAELWSADGMDHGCRDN